MAFSNGYTIGFAAGICLVCSLAVASAAQGLKPMQDLNKKRDVQANILKSVGLPEDGGMASGEQVDALYADRIKVEVFDLASGKVKGDLTEADYEAEKLAAKAQGREPELGAVFKRVDGGKVVSYSFPMDGKGLWGPISGYVAVGSDGDTVSGATFFAPKETPGLGYEITSAGFTSQWPGKKLYEGGKLSPVDVTKAGACNTAENVHCVDGVSGATITTRGVDAMVESSFNHYQPYLASIRN